MTAPTVQSTFPGDIHRRLLDSCVRAKTLARDLDRVQMSWSPGETQWSIGQCLDHMSLGAELYAKNMESAIEAARSRGSEAVSDLQPRHTFMGRQIIRAVEPTAKRKMKAPKVFAPSDSAVSEDPLGRFLTVHEKIADLVASSDGYNFNRIKFSSPVAWFIRINAADAFEILASHAERHLAQAERVREAPGFPAETTAPPGT